MKKVILYIYELAKIGGIETFTYNFCQYMKDYYDITVAVKLIPDNQYERLSKIVKVDRDIYKTMRCDTLIMLRVTDTIPTNIKYQKVIRRIHTRKFYDIQTLPKDADLEVCVSESVKEDWGLTDAVVINNLCQKSADDSLLLVSATRIPAKDKGDNEQRFRTLANMMNNAKIPFLWLNFSDRKMDNAPRNFYNLDYRLDVQSYMKRASYIVQLSTVEACSNTVLEALNLNVPLICTPVPCFFELGVVDGVNAHVVPFDMRFDVNKLLTIPKYDFRYDNERRVEQWKQIL